jgi:hypothetical protein
MTCAHVVAGVDACTVRFHNLTTPIEVHATVKWRDRYDPATGRGDLAVLRLARSLATEIRQVPFAPFTALSTYHDRALTAHGFPRKFSAGVDTKCEVIAHNLIDGEFVQVQPINAVDRPLERGFSGAAVVLHTSYNVVVGMVTSVHDGEEGRWVGRILTPQVMCQIWPELLAHITLGDFSAPAYTQLRELLFAVTKPAAARIYSDATQGFVAPQAPRLTSALAVVEYLATDFSHDPDLRRTAVGRALSSIGEDRANEALREQLSQWSSIHLYPVREPIVVTPEPDAPPRASVFVEIERSVAPGKPPYRVRISTRFTGGGRAFGDEALMSRSKIRDYVVEQLVEALESIPTDQYKEVVVEFALPRGWLTSERVHGWRSPYDPSNRDLEIGYEYPVVVRDYERFQQPVQRHLLYWAEIDAASKAGRPVFDWVACTDSRDVDRVGRKIRLDDRPRGLALTTSPKRSKLVDVAMRGAVPVMIWPSWECANPGDGSSPHESCNGRQFADQVCLKMNQATESDPLRLLPRIVKNMRIEARDAGDDREQLLRDFVLLFDDPNWRRVAHLKSC